MSGKQLLLLDWKYPRCCLQAAGPLHKSWGKKWAGGFSSILCKNCKVQGWSVGFIVDSQHFLLVCEGLGAGGGLRRHVVFFIESEAYFQAILGTANIPCLDTRLCAPLFYSVMYVCMGTCAMCSRKIQIAELDQSACPTYPVSNQW